MRRFCTVRVSRCSPTIQTQSWRDHERNTEGFGRPISRISSARSLFVREFPKPGSSTCGNVTRSGTRKNLLILYLLIFQDEVSFYKYGLSSITDEIGRLLNNDASQKKLVSSLVAQLLSDLSIAAECLRQLNLSTNSLST